MFASVFSGGIIKKALERELVKVRVHDLRDFTRDKHRQVDDRPYGGSEGMVLKPEPIFSAVKSIRENERSPVCLLSPQGRTFDHRMAEALSGYPQVILICGRYEGVDERVMQSLVTQEISIGDYILTGGEPAAVVVVDAVCRFVAGVVGKKESVVHDSFHNGLLDFPQYTRPRDFQGMKVPPVLFSGDHKKIEQWRKRKSLEKTWLQRPDLLERREFTSEEKEMLDEIKKERKGQ
jgi:tRNA (guanine37-N1)-methyltransferase